MKIIHQKDPRFDIDDATVAPADTASSSKTDLQITLKGKGPWPMKWRVTGVVAGKGQTVINLEAEPRV